MSSTDKPKRGRPRIHKDGGQLLAVYLPRELVAWARARAERLGVPVSQVVAEAIEGMITGQN